MNKILVCFVQLVFLSFLLFKCTPPNATPLPSGGVEIPAPPGFEDFCKRYSGDSLCREIRKVS